MHSVFTTFNKRIQNIFFILGCWLLPEKFSFCPKNNGFARVRAPLTPHTLMKTMEGFEKILVGVSKSVITCY